MKRINYFVIAVMAMLTIVACNQVSYKKTKSGLLYKIIPGKGKDSLLKEGQIVKFHYTAKLGDSVLYSSYDKLPGFAKIQPMQKPPYNLFEILPLMRNGDSAVTIQMTDTLIKQQMQLPPGTKKGERLITTMRIVQVFSSENEAMADYTREMEKDKPRQEKQKQEEMVKMQKSILEQREKLLKEAEQTGDAGKQRKAMEAYLGSKKVTAQKTAKGTYYVIKEQGTGAQAAAGKYVTIKYTGRVLATDSTFESNIYPSLQLGMGGVIEGWEDGLLQFKEGGKGTLYIPGYLAYGKPGRPPFGPDEALIFDIEIIKVSDTPDDQPQQP